MPGSPQLRTYIFIRNVIDDDRREILSGCYPVSETFAIDMRSKNCVFLRLDEGLLGKTIYTDLDVYEDRIRFDIVREPIGGQRVQRLLDKVPDFFKEWYKRLPIATATEMINTPEYGVDSSVLALLDVDALILIQTEILDVNEPMNISLLKDESFKGAFKAKGRAIELSADYGFL
ncbi:hypothetical protein [Neptuniibacter marinus]|uniref:hypothetical protein n=1 Tax=Neptuniibacter marinus TaxID=1806670 RepID=UPI00083778DB|nr:hypothetical protein [Neptuniibacter marinus]